MLPLFAGDERRKRRINLGGASAVASHDEVLQQAKANRNERQLARRRQEAAVTLQAFWRGKLSKNKTGELLRARFDENVTGIDAMRCLVLLGNDEERLGRWSEAVSSMDEASVLEFARGSHRQSWLVLVQQLALMLLHSVSVDPRSPCAQAHLKVLSILLSPSTVDRVVPYSGAELSQQIALYLLRRDYYQTLEATLEAIPPSEAKTTPILPSLTSLISAPLAIFAQVHDVYLFCFRQILQFILTIPLLPNRLPLASLTQLSASLPLQSFNLTSSISYEITSPLSSEQRIHLVANLATFMPPRYAKLNAPSLESYLRFLALVLADFPSYAFEPPSAQVAALQTSWAHGEDSDGEQERNIAGSSSFSGAQPLIQRTTVDGKTRSRLQTLASPFHVSALLSATNAHPSARLGLYAFLMQLYTAWPARAEKLLTTVSAASGGGLVRELYRGYVRGSPLGKSDDANPKSLVDPANASSWVPLLFLTDLYTQALLTMGDAEFFHSSKTHATSSSAQTVPAAHRNSLTVDEVISFSRQLMNIAFTLYWNESQPGMLEGKAPGTSIGWESVRDKVTKLVQAIQARDSRRPFTPPDHWLCSTQLDMISFVQAAIYEEQQLSEESDFPSSHGQVQIYSKRQIAQISPRLGVLNNIPFAIPFEIRVQIFRQFIANDMIKHAGGADRFERQHARTRTRAIVRRGHVATDGFDKLGNANLKGLVEISFIDQFGQEEAGIDGGGVFKEFFTELCKEVFDTDRGLWLATKNNELYPNPHSYAKEPHNLDWYRFIGRILGKALYEGILVDVAFAGFFLAKWLGKQSFLDDLASLDLELYNGLLFLKNYLGNPEDLSLTFAVVEDELGVARTVDLLPNGSNIPVTRENRLQYIFLICHYRLTKQIRPQSEAFFQGLSEMIDPRWIRMFNQQELQILIGGVNSPIDLEDLRANTNYGGLYSDDDDTIRAFWRVVSSLDQSQRRLLLRFATSCSRPPLLGFRELQPKFSIRDAGSDQNRLPTASTCVNLLKLPRYTNDNVLREKLLQAITSNAGFDLS